MTLPTAGQAADATAITPSSAVTDFTVMIDLSRMPAAWWADVDTSDGTRGRASNHAGSTEYAVDWIDFDDTAETGRACVLVPGMHSSITGVDVRLYAPNTRNAAVAASATYGSDNAYGSDLIDYWTLDESPTGVVVNRTASGGDLSSSGSMTTADLVAGQVGNAIEFDGVDDYLVGTSTSVGTSHTIMCWVRMNFDYGRGFLVRVANGIELLVDYSLNYSIYGSDFENIGTPSGGWDHVAVTRDGTSVDGYLGFLNGVQTLATTRSFTDGASNNRSLGSELGGGFLNGVLDEAKVFNAIKSPGWIEHEFNQTYDNATFWGTWAAVTLGASGNRRRRLLLMAS